MRKYFVCSVGKPGEDYVEDNLKRIVEGNGFVLHENTKQKGSYSDIRNQDILLLKYNNSLIAYGEAKEMYQSRDAEWNLRADVDHWRFNDSKKMEHGADLYGLKDATIGGGQYGTVKEVEEGYASQKIKQINYKTDLYSKLQSELQFQKRNEIMEKYIVLLKSNKNLIFTGAPGTGKTYLAKQIAKKIVDISISSKPIDILKDKIKQYKADVDRYNELENIRLSFIEKFPIDSLQQLSLEEYCIGAGNADNFCWWLEVGLNDLGRFTPAQRGSLIYGVYYNSKNEEYRVNNKSNRFEAETTPEEALKTMLNLIFGALNSEEGLKKAINSNLIDNGFLLKILYTYLPKTYLPINGKGHLTNILNMLELEDSKKENAINKNLALIELFKKLTVDTSISELQFMSIIYSNFNVAEGEIKDNQKNLVLKGDVEFVQFHPSYDYTDFVEGLRPVKKEGEELGFELKNGTFKLFCKKAKKNPNKNYVFIIDEINRAEISKVFGELFFSIDPGYRGENGRVKTQYANIQTEETYFTDKDNDFFYIPENVYIIGTMNDIDRSVESFDFAMRRRFAWKEITAKERIGMWRGDHKDAINNYAVEAEIKMNDLNEAIESIEGLNSSYHIGPAYFLKLNNYEGDFEKLWNNHIHVLLNEYLRGMHDADTKMDKLKKAYFS